MPPDPATTATEPASECCAKCPHVHHLGIGCWRCIVAALDAHAAAAVAKEREKWVDAVPTEPGWYWWRSAPSSLPAVKEVRRVGKGLSINTSLGWKRVQCWGGQWYRAEPPPTPAP